MRQVLEAFTAKLRNERERWYTDNQNVTRIIVTGSKNTSLQQEALAIFSASVANSIRIEPEWIPREENKLADYMSRIVDYDDWITLFSSSWTIGGFCTPSTDLPVITMCSFHILTHASGTLALKLSMHLLPTGPKMLTGSAHQYT